MLGIHSTINPGTGGSFKQLMDGHAWISMTRGGETQLYGLWPDRHPNVPDNGLDSDIRVGVEAGAAATASRYDQITPQQAAELETRQTKNVKWASSNSCASWAGDIVRAVTGHRLQSSDLFGLSDPPRRLVSSIDALEQQRDTSPENPLRPD